jgi:transcriptional regulator with PAS, ATPase and Fis domain
VDLGTFRLDLMYRLQVVELHIPPLRERQEDIVPLADCFLEKYGAENGRPALEVSDEARDLLYKYAWPGNVRELENVMERATVIAGKDDLLLTAKLLPPSLKKAA